MKPNQVADYWGRIAAEVIDARERQWQRGNALDFEPISCPFATLTSALWNDRATLVLSLLGRNVDGLTIAKRISVNSAPMEPIAEA